MDNWKDFVQLRDSEVDILKTEAHRGDKEIIDQANRIIHLENYVRSKDVVTSILKMHEKTVLGDDSDYTKIEATAEISSTGRSSLSLD